jgi:hypothetical protein
MNTNATGQLFGYALQFPRALLRLLQANSGAKIVIEELGDVADVSPNGSIVTEEDKSSLTGNALADRSINLWKTFYNWINAVDTGNFVVNRDRFVLYTNHSVPANSLAQTFSVASDATSAQAAFEKACAVLADVGDGRDLFKYKDKVLNQSAEVFRAILQRFELVADSKADDVYPEIRQFLGTNAFVPDEDVEWVLHEITGWLQTTIIERIAIHQSACVSRDELKTRIQPILHKINSKGLVDYAVSQIPNHDELSRRVGERPVYVRQLEHISLGDDRIIEAVSDYFRVDTNRLEWIEKGLVCEADMEDFENKLVSFHGNEQQAVELTQSQLQAEKRGQLLLANCQKYSTKIAEKDPPDKTAQGSYHVLADEMRLGWHPQWHDKMRNETNGGEDGTAY